MAIRVKHKRGTTAPTTSDIEIGELAIDYVNQKLYSANSTDVFEIGGNAGNATRVYQAFTATASQTTFTVDDGYSVGNIDVFINGVKLAEDEYTATDGDDVVLDVGAINGAIVEVVGWLIVPGATSGIANPLTESINANSFSITSLGLLEMGPSVRAALSYTSSNTDPQVIDTIDKSTYRSGKYTVTVKNNATNAYQISELLVIHDDSETDAYLQEHGVVITNAVCATFSANANSTVIRLYTTPVVASSVFRLTKELHIV